MHGAVFGEFLGTMVLLLFGNGVVANVVLDRSKGKDSGWIVITAGWGFAVFCGIVVSLGVGGVAQLNPAVTLAGAIVSGDYSHVVPYVAAQMAGAVVSGGLVWLVYLPHWATSDPDSKLAAFCTQPAIRAPAHNVLSELIGTVMLIVIGMALAAKGFVFGGLAPGMGPFFWGILVWALGLSLGQVDQIVREYDASVSLAVSVGVEAIPASKLLPASVERRRASLLQPLSISMSIDDCSN